MSHFWLTGAIVWFLLAVGAVLLLPFIFSAIVMAVCLILYKQIEERYWDSHEEFRDARERGDLSARAYVLFVHGHEYWEDVALLYGDTVLYVVTLQWARLVVRWLAWQYTRVIGP